MKKLLKAFFINLFAFVFAWQYLPSIVLTGSFEQLIIAAIVLTLLDKFLKPVLKIITFPLKFVTFGLFDIVLTALVFYLTTEFTDGIEVISFVFNGLETDFLIIPPTEISTPWDYVVSALGVVIFSRILSWVFKAKVVEESN